MPWPQINFDQIDISKDTDVIKKPTQIYQGTDDNTGRGGGGEGGGQCPDFLQSLPQFVTIYNAWIQIVSCYVGGFFQLRISELCLFLFP